MENGKLTITFMKGCGETYGYSADTAEWANAEAAPIGNYLIVYATPRSLAREVFPLADIRSWVDNLPSTD